jgi:hypothetical protein
MRRHGAYIDKKCMYCAMAKIKYLDLIEVQEEIIRNSEKEIELLKQAYRDFDKYLDRYELKNIDGEWVRKLVPKGEEK